MSYYDIIFKMQSPSDLLGDCIIVSKKGMSGDIWVFRHEGYCLAEGRPHTINTQLPPDNNVYGRQIQGW